MAELKPISQSLRGLIESSNACAVSTSRSDPETAVERARLLAGCYRKDDAADPEIYAGAIAAVLAQYPADIVRSVTDPRSGLPSKIQWLPSVKEVRDACEEIDGQRRRIAQVAAQAEQQLEDRRKFEAAKDHKPTYDELRAKYGENWGLSAGEKENERVKAARLEMFARANTESFEAECQAAGIDSANGVSPSLAAIIHRTATP